LWTFVDIKPNYTHVQYTVIPHAFCIRKTEKGVLVWYVYLKEQLVLQTMKML